MIPLHQTYVFSDSVLCSVQPRKDNIKLYLETRYLKELDQIDGEPMEFEWNNFPGFTRWEFSLRFKR